MRKESKEFMKHVIGISLEMDESLQNLKQVFTNTLNEHFLKDKDRLNNFYEDSLNYS